MKTIRTGITRRTTGQCSRIAGGDPGMVLVGGGNGGGYSGGDMAMATMGVGYAGGPMVSVTIGLPGDAPLSRFDNFLIGAMGTVTGAAAGGFVIGALTGVGLYLATNAISTSLGYAVATSVRANSTSGQRTRRAPPAARRSFPLEWPIPGHSLKGNAS